MTVIKLYDNVESQNGYKIRLAASNMQLKYEWVPLNLQAGDQKQDWFLKLNPNGKVPTLVDGDFTIWESNAILLYLGKRFVPNTLIPQGLPQLGVMLEWMFFEATQLSRTVGSARFLTRYMPPERVNPQELARTREQANRAIKILNGHLAGQDFLAGSYSLADISCYAQLVVASEGKIGLDDFQAIQRWQKRVEDQPGYLSMHPPQQSAKK